MAKPNESDFPPGHPGRCDYDPASSDAQEWARVNVHPLGERDFPVDHPKAVDTPGNESEMSWAPGIDPRKPHLEAFTGRTPAQAKAARDAYLARLPQSKPTPAATPTIAAPPPLNPNVERARRDEDSDRVTIFCPACREPHTTDSRWQFNGSLTLPTFVPSLNWHRDDASRHCHSVVTNGQISFLPDSGHALKGQTVELPPITAMEDTIHGTRS
jgi:hypothetical protein